ncbi:thioesterase II family protein [Photobacterium sp. DNB22_13_2]
MSKWWIRHNSENATLRVFLFPYAGGSAAIYNQWLENIPSHVEIIQLQLPGRANRFNEPLISSMPELINELGKEIAPLTDLPYIIFGHSMGGRICHNLINFLDANNHPLPIHFIASGCKAPHQERHKSGTHLLPKKEFIDEIKRLNATPDEILNNIDFFNIYIDILRADFEVADYQSDIPKNKKKIPFTLFLGLFDDEVDISDIDEWKLHFNKEFSVKLFNGGHFFINTEFDNIIKEMNKIIM